MDVPGKSYPLLYFTTPGSVGQWFYPELPAAVSQPVYVAVKAENIMGDGTKETLVIRQDEVRRLTWNLTGWEVRDYGKFAQEVGLRQKQFQVLLDRNVGVVYTFQNTYGDVANLHPTSYNSDATGTCSYSWGPGGYGLNVDSGYRLIIRNMNFLTPVYKADGGTITMIFVPQSLSTETASSQYLLSTYDNNALDTFYIYKSSCHWISFNVYMDTGSANTLRWSAASWTSTDVITLIARWTNQGSIQFWFGRNGHFYQASYYAPNTFTGYISNPASIMYVGNAHPPANWNWGIRLLHFSIHHHTSGSPFFLGSYIPMGRNYYDKAELMETTVTPRRLTPGVELWTAEATIRQGY